MNTAADIMTGTPVTVTPGTTLRDAAKLLLDGHFNGLPVVEGDKLVGMLTQSDIISMDKKVTSPGFFLMLGGDLPVQIPGQLSRDLQRMAATTVGEIMSPDPFTITPQTTTEEIADIIVEKRYYSLPVVEDGKLVGIVGMEDMLKRLASN